MPLVRNGSRAAVMRVEVKLSCALYRPFVLRMLNTVDGASKLSGRDAFQKILNTGCSGMPVSNSFGRAQ